MGFNTWNAFGCSIDEATVRAIASTMVADGLRDAGYNFVNVDDCWGAPNRTASGKLQANHARFASGMKALGDYLHTRKFRFGIYADAGTHTCNKSGFPGSLGHELADARSFASWGVDYLKYDNCNRNSVPARQRYQAMRNALDRVARPIVYAMSTWGHYAPWTWAPRIASLWRTSKDIHDSWTYVIANLRANQGHAAVAGPGHWNDPDMLEVGNSHMTHTEQRSQMSLWAMMAAPLLISTDLRKADAFTLKTLKNPGVIAIDQDPLGRQATIVHTAGRLTSYTKPLANGDRAVALFNESARARTVSTTATAVGLASAGTYRLVDLWSGKRTSSSGTISAVVPAHGTVLYRVHQNPAPPPAGLTALSRVTPKSAVNGWGPIERDRSNGEKAPGDGRPLTIAGKAYVSGLGTHALSRITWLLGRRCSQLDVDVGVDDEVGRGGSVQFQVLADAKLVARTGTLTGSDPAQHLVANLTGANLLTLVVNATGDGMRDDHADWARPRIRCG
jgi:alpha-galactosidase